VHGAGHEIGHHGWSHVPPALLNRQEEEEGLVRANEQIKKLTGSYARGYRSPAWDLSPNSVALLLKHGFLYDSSMMGNDFTPYRVRQGDLITLDKPAVFGKTTRLIEMPVSWTLDDHPHFEFIRTKEWILPGLMNANLVLDDWINDFNYMKKKLEWGVIIYTFHPYVIGRGGRMLILEKLIRKLKDSGVVFTTVEAAAAEYEKRQPFKG
jgi:peptidoglycan/xylan/chitin deacetylase (PgdA/CDA1 family)